MCAFLMIVLSATLCCLTNHVEAGEQGLILSAEGQFVKVDLEELRILATGNLWEGSNVWDEQNPYEYLNHLIFEVTVDRAHRRMFVLTGKHELDGYLVFDLDTLKYKAKIGRSMALDADPVLVITPDAKKIYLSYFNLSLRKRETIVFDGENYELIGRLPDTVIAEGFGFLRDGTLYTATEILDVRSDATLSKPVISGKPLGVYDERVVTLVDNQGKTVITVSDVRSGGKINEVSTEIPFSYYPGKNPQWQLARSGRLVYDEVSRIEVGGGLEVIKTGRLLIYDLRVGKNLGSVRVPIKDPPYAINNMILGFTSSDKRLLYKSGRTLSLVDLERLVIVRSVELPFIPVAFVPLNER